MSEPRPTPTRQIPEPRAQLAFDAAYEVSSLAAVARRLIDEANLDQLGKACCGMLTRIEQLAEAISVCIDEDPNTDNLVPGGLKRVGIVVHGAYRGQHP